MTRRNVILIRHPLRDRLIYQVRRITVIGSFFWDKLVQERLVLLVALVYLSGGHPLLKLAPLLGYLAGSHLAGLWLTHDRRLLFWDSHAPLLKRTGAPLLIKQVRIPFTERAVVLDSHPLEIVHAAVLYLVAWWGIHSQLPRCGKPHIATNDHETLTARDNKQRPRLEELRRLDDACGQARYVLLRPVSWIAGNALYLARVEY